MRKKLSRKIKDIVTFIPWYFIHPRTVKRLGIIFKINPWVVPYYIIRKNTFLRLLPIFDSYVKTDSVVLDIGASFGYYSLYCTKILNAKKVIAFEPTAQSYNLLIDNLIKNNVDRVVTYRCAVGDKIDRIKLNYNLWGSGDNSIIEKDSWKYEWVDMITIDSLAQSQVDFVKIDVEGAEYVVLKGMKKL